MTAFRTLFVLIATLALIGVVEAQKGGGKPGGGGGTPTPYTPVVVNVACDGTGTKLQDALNALNPVANVYEVRVSGVCPERVSVRSFNHLRIVSLNQDAPAILGGVKISFTGYIALETVKVNGQFGGSPAISAFKSDIGVKMVDVNCNTSAGKLLSVKDGYAQVFGLTHSDCVPAQGPYPAISLSDSAAVDLVLTQDSFNFPPGDCENYFVQAVGGVVLNITADYFCSVNELRAERNSTVNYDKSVFGNEASPKPRVIAMRSQVYGYDARAGAGEWFSESSGCQSDLSGLYDGAPLIDSGKNYCSPTN